MGSPSQRKVSWTNHKYEWVARLSKRQQMGQHKIQLKFTDTLSRSQQNTRFFLKSGYMFLRTRFKQGMNHQQLISGSKLFWPTINIAKNENAIEFSNKTPTQKKPKYFFDCQIPPLE